MERDSSQYYIMGKAITRAKLKNRESIACNATHSVAIIVVIPAILPAVNITVSLSRYNSKMVMRKSPAIVRNLETAS